MKKVTKKAQKDIKSVEAVLAPRVVGYTRVSTSDQNTESQHAVISNYCMSHDLKLDEVISETISSRKTERVVYDLIKELNSGDTLLVSKLDRLGRGTYDTLKIIDEIKAKNIKLIIIVDNIIVDGTESSAIAQMTLTILSAFSQLERDFISERTKSALAAKIASGVKLGRKEGAIVKSKYDDHIVEIEKQIKMRVSLHGIIKNLGIGSVPSLSAWAKKRGLIAS